MSHASHVDVFLDSTGGYCLFLIFCHILLVGHILSMTIFPSLTLILLAEREMDVLL